MRFEVSREPSACRPSAEVEPGVWVRVPWPDMEGSMTEVQGGVGDCGILTDYARGSDGGREAVHVRQPHHLAG